MNTLSKTIDVIKAKKIPLSYVRAIQEINDAGIQDREFYTIGLSEMAGTAININDDREARLTYLYFVQEVLKNQKNDVSVKDLLASAKEKAQLFIKDPNSPDVTLRPQYGSATPKLDCLGQPKRKKGAKQEQAVEVYKANMNSKTKAEIIELFMSEVGMSKAGATTYYYNIKKLVSG